jgi:hypothetical protein
VNTTKVTGRGATDHDVMEVRDDKVGRRQVDVHRQRGEEQPGQTAHDEETDKAQGVDKVRRKLDRPFVHGRDPVEDL